jgi:rhomboid protease GluP
MDTVLELTLPIEYQASGGQENAVFKGSGVLVLRHSSGTMIDCRFTGRHRRMIGTGPEGSLEFAEAELSNVVRSGRCVQFVSSKGIAGTTQGVFVFYCRDEAEAGRVLALMPARCDADFLERLDFAGRLARLEGSSHPLLSVTHLLMLANAAVFVLMAGFLGAGWGGTSNLHPYVEYGANNGAVTTDGEWWRLLTHQFMHYGLMHLGFNLWALYQGGHFVERLQGRALYLLTYLGSGACGGLLSILWNGDKVWSAGASGAIFGVFGCVLGYLLRERQALPASVYKPMLRSTLVFAGYNLVFGMVYPGIDNAAHVGGFLSGALLGWLGSMPLDPARRARALPGRLAAVALACAVLVGAGVAFTPRYPYNLREELAFAEAMSPVGARETRLIERLMGPLDAWEKAGRLAGEPSLEGLLRDEIIPFYVSLQATAEGLHFKPGKATASRVAALHEYSVVKQRAFRSLLRAVHAGDSRAYGDYVEACRSAEAPASKLAEAR